MDSKFKVHFLFKMSGLNGNELVKSFKLEYSISTSYEWIWFCALFVSCYMPKLDSFYETVQNDALWWEACLLIWGNGRWFRLLGFGQ